MAILTDEEKKRIEEEEETRARVRLKYEKKSSGVAGVLSSVCPGLGQIYNGQLGKATLYVSVILISLLILSGGIYFQVKGMPTKEKPVAIEKSEPVEMNEEGVVLEAEEEKATEEKEKECDKKPATPVVLILVGAIGIMAGWNYSIKDAVRTAKRINASY